MLSSFAAKLLQLHPYRRQNIAVSFDPMNVLHRVRLSIGQILDFALVPTNDVWFLQSGFVLFTQLP